MIEITIRGEPVPWARAGKRGGFSFTPAKQRRASLDIGQEARKVMGSRPVLQGPLSLQLVFTYHWPASTPKKRRADPIARFRSARPDLDNLVKLVCDSLNGIVWTDDAQVAKLSAIKTFGPIPSISLIVFEIDEFVIAENPGTVVPLCVA